MLALGLALAVLVLVTACTPPARRSLEAYHDPNGLFTSSLPGANNVQVMSAGQFSQGVDLLSGVTSSAEQSSGQGGLSRFSQPDQGVFLIYALSADGWTSAEDVASAILDDPAFTMDTQETFPFQDEDGLLVIGDYEGDQGAFGLAAGFLLHERVGYWIIEIFPSGQWASQQDDFRKILSSFHSGAPPGVAAVPLSPPS